MPVIVVELSNVAVLAELQHDVSEEEILDLVQEILQLVYNLLESLSITHC